MIVIENKKNKKNEKNKKIRFVLIDIVIFLIGALLIFQLVTLQIVKGESYWELSQRRLFREASIQAPRGEIYDRNGMLLATNREAFSIQIVRTLIEPDKLNTMILSLVTILEKNGDVCIDNFPMTINPIKLDIKVENDSDNEKLKKFKEKFKINNTDNTDEKIFEGIRKYYQIPDYFTAEKARKVIAVRYEMATRPFSQFDPVTVAVDVSKETVAELEEKHLAFPGVNIDVSPVREYPNGSIASHVLGYIGKINSDELENRKGKGYRYDDTIGKDGIEKMLEELLKGKDGLRKVETDSTGRLTGEIGEKSPEPGNNIYLTIDLKLQEVAEKVLKDTINKINSGGYADRFPDAQSGAVVAMDVKTGEVLTMASYPSYDSSKFVKGISSKDWSELMHDERKPMMNKAIKGRYSPGSTFKMLTAIAALQEGKVAVDEQILDRGIYDRYGEKNAPKCWIYKSGHTHGYVNVSEAIKVSCNYYFYEMGYRTKIDNLNKYVKMFGLGSKTGIELPGEINGIIAGPEFRKESKGERWYPGDTLSAAIGQSDYAFTPIQMVSYISTLVNGGVKNRPHLVMKSTSWKSEANSENKLEKYLGYNLKSESEVLNLSKYNVKAIMEGMESVTGDAGGTAYGTFAGFPIRIGGKTGTVQASGSDHGWFVGFAPYDDPQIAVAVIIEHGGHGGYTAPVAKDIIAQYFGIYKDTKIIY